jgi:hypothetical protein
LHSCLLPWECVYQAVAQKWVCMLQYETSSWHC